MAGHVAVRAGGPVARQGAEHQTWVDLDEFVETEAQLRQGTRAHRLQHDVGPTDQIAVDLQALLGLEVDGDAALAPVGVEVEK